LADSFPVAISSLLNQDLVMRVEAIEKALHAERFVPFRIVLPSDRSVKGRILTSLPLRQIENGCWFGTDAAGGA